MTDNFKTIADAFQNAGVDVHTAEYSITAYSLNTSLSFKFSNLEEFLSFLGPTAGAGTEKINAMLIEAGVDPGSFFYVNFYKPKVAEL
ncbi:hypothetical protein HYN59_12840 [Flavobacterium album]|uniref:Uncharacterized protein n=1 Tax=Flavobacterium album TaxID=2175091 RepID=A0A2S1QZV0_9FLAO|nr:hypothetical protein [Flavobacterium album]AWH85938.1 hypothetical protein HYN59_12840 [Flavobacterium album]